MAMIYRKNLETAISVGADYAESDQNKLQFTPQQLDSFAQMIAYECLAECASIGIEEFGVNDGAVTVVDRCISKIRKRFSI